MKIIGNYRFIKSTDSKKAIVHSKVRELIEKFENKYGGNNDSGKSSIERNVVNLKLHELLK